MTPPAIEHRGEIGEPEPRRDSQPQVEILSRPEIRRGLGGYDLQNKYGMIAFARLGYHYDSFQISDVADFTKNSARIPNQIIHKLTGVLVHSVEGCAFQIRYLLTHPEFARTIGANGREHVKENFLMTSNVKRWLLLFRILEQAKARLPKAA